MNTKTIEVIRVVIEVLTFILSKIVKIPFLAAKKVVKTFKSA